MTHDSPAWAQPLSGARTLYLRRRTWLSFLANYAVGVGDLLHHAFPRKDSSE